MIEITGNIWDFQTPMTPICITTNGTVKSNLECVMGRGVALEAKQKYYNLPWELGNRIEQYGNKSFYFPNYDLITFPVKHNWNEIADIELIQRSANSLLDMAKRDYIEFGWEKIYVVRPGCGNGQLNWVNVKPILEKILISDNFVIVEKECPVKS